MVDLNEIAQLENEVQKLRQEKDEAKGRLSLQLKELKEKYNCTTLKQAQLLLKKNKEEVKKLSREYNDLRNILYADWPDLLM